MTDNVTGEAEEILVASADATSAIRFSEVLSSSYIVTTVTDPAEMLSRLACKCPSVLMIDAELYPDNTNDQLLAVTSMANATHVIVIESRDTGNMNQHMLFRAGVHGFCKRDITDVLLRKAVQLVLDGDYWVQRKLITQVISDMAAERSSASSGNFDRTLVDSLTPRELQVARLVHMGGNNKTIARELDISERTVKAHLSAIFRKLEIENRLNLALFFSELT